MSGITICGFGKAVYYMIKSHEFIDGVPVCMYGIKGICDGENISLAGLSDDPTRIMNLVNNMNLSGIELCQFKDVVEDFLFDNYGMITF